MYGRSVAAELRLPVVFWSPLLTLDPKTVSSRVPRAAGVYRLSRQPMGASVSVVFYVGEARDIRARLLEHMSVLEPNARLRNTIQDELCYFRFAAVASDETRRGIERALFDHFSVKGELLNTDVPPGPAAEVNLG